MPERTTRPGRSNSFQRMLELERQYMLERLQMGKPQQQEQANTSSPRRQSPQRSSIQTRRADLRPTSSSKARHEDASPVRRPAPLVIDTLASRPRSETAVQRMHVTPVMDDAPTAVATPVEKPSPKVVAFEFPPKEMYPPKESDRRSICVSPSWESHGRRKKEKKMMEKKQKEERKAKEKEAAARIAEAKSKRRPARLSKQPPPTSSTDALNKVERAAPSEPTAGARGRQKERPSSVVCLTSTYEATMPRKTRSRSGSFASLIRAPFERRRSSVDHNAQPEFLGGIKLEFERHLAQERALNGQAVSGEANIHPALRSEKPTNRRWSSPLKSPPPPARASGDSQDPNRRAYPPITRHGKAPTARSLISPTAPAIPDLSTIDKWRHRVGLNPTPASTDGKRSKQETSAAVSNQDAGVIVQNNTPKQGTPLRQDNKAIADASPTPSGSEGMAAAATQIPEGSRRIATQPSHIDFSQALPATDMIDQNKENKSLSNNESVSSSVNCRAEPSSGYRTAPSSPPPEPPRRSSKRNSLISLNESIPPLPTSAKSDNGSASSPAFRSASREGVRSATPSHPRLTETKVSGSPAQKFSSRKLRHAPVSSSEDSCSEDLHSPSPPSTPATSRPQSEKGLPILSNGDTVLTLPANTPEPMDDEDEIQAAADRALASFCKAVVGRQGLPRSGINLESAAAAAADGAPFQVPRLEPLRIKAKKMAQQANRASAPAANPVWKPPPVSMDQLSRPMPATASAPAVYLEEARKLPPAAPVTRTPKQRLGPPASFVLPDEPASPSASPKTPCSPATTSTSPHHTLTPSHAQPEREPVAKVFVECCGCRYYHDMPSHLYEAMANPDGVLKSQDRLKYAGAISMTVKCPWCRHEMSTKCCAGLAAMVYVTERLH